MYARVSRYAIRTDRISEAHEYFVRTLDSIRALPGMRGITIMTGEDGKGIIVALYENKAAAGAAAPQILEHWRQIGSFLTGPPVFEEFATVLVAEVS